MTRKVNSGDESAQANESRLMPPESPSIPMLKLIDGLGIDAVAITAASARRSAAADDRWREDIHHAGLNFGGCFADQVAQFHDCRLLYAGDDFVNTDVNGVL
jgi:ribonuclease VapC